MAAPEPQLPAPIAIDGPAASGKSSLGRALAEQLDYSFLDTGLMYRAFALAALRRAIPAVDEAACTALAQALALRADVSRDTRILLDGEDVTEHLRSEEVEAAVSGYSAIPGVREVMVRVQREIAARGRAVLAGRDIGTVVLPDAPLKFYLEAAADARARRREGQVRAEAQSPAPAAVEAVSARDAVDSTRAASPLRPASDAVVVDTTAMSLDDVIGFALRTIRERSSAAPPARPPAPSRRRRAARLANRVRSSIPLPGWHPFVVAFYWWAHYALRLVLVIFGRWKVTGREHIPKTGALIIVSNHLNNVDPPILASAITGRRVRYMAKIELFRWPGGLIPRLYGAFPVRRFEADMGALLSAERLLKRGEVLGMFPEGTRSRTGFIGRPLPGTALIALRSGATVLPCGIAGTEQLRNPLNVLRKPRISVAIGEPIAITAVRRPTEEQVSELTDRVFEAITSLIPPRYVRAYTEDEAAREDGRDRPGK